MKPVNIHIEKSKKLISPFKLIPYVIIFSLIVGTGMTFLQQDSMQKRQPEVYTQQGNCSPGCKAEIKSTGWLADSRNTNICDGKEDIGRYMMKLVDDNKCTKPKPSDNHVCIEWINFSDECNGCCFPDEDDNGTRSCSSGYNIGCSNESIGCYKFHSGIMHIESVWKPSGSCKDMDANYSMCYKYWNCNDSNLPGICENFCGDTTCADICGSKKNMCMKTSPKDFFLDVSRQKCAQKISSQTRKDCGYDYCVCYQEWDCTDANKPEGCANICGGDSGDGGDGGDGGGIDPGDACQSDSDCGSAKKSGCAVQCLTDHCPGHEGCGKTEGTSGAVNCQAYPPAGYEWKSDYSECVYTGGNGGGDGGGGGGGKCDGGWCVGNCDWCEWDDCRKNHSYCTGDGDNMDNHLCCPPGGGGGDGGGGGGKGDSCPVESYAVPNDAVCANPKLSKLNCGATGTGCRNDNTVAQDCNNGGDLYCIDQSGSCKHNTSDGDSETTGQCVRFNANGMRINDFFIKSLADNEGTKCEGGGKNGCNDLDVYIKKTGLEYWEVAGNNLNQRGINGVSINAEVEYIDICNDHDDCDIRIDWVKYTGGGSICSAFNYDNSNSVIDIADLLIVFNNWGNGFGMKELLGLFDCWGASL